MEIRQYLLLFKRWAWLLILGAVLGGAAAYGLSSMQPVVYQTSTRVMVSSSPEIQNQSYNYYLDSQLVKTYAQIINSEPIMKKLSERLGYPVYGGQVQVSQIPDANLLQLTVMHNDPQRAAEIANTLVEVFIDYNTGLQDERYKSTEESLQAQIAQVEAQISLLQDEMSHVSESTLETERQQIEKQSRQIEEMLASVEDEIISLETQIETFIPTPAVTNTPAPSWIIPTSTPVPVPTPTLSSAAQMRYKELQIRRDQLDDMRVLFQQAYGNLLVLQQSPNSDPALRQSQIQTTLALYQQIYSNLLSSYENVRLARLRSTPNVVQIEPARVPGGPIQPQPMRSGMLGAISGFLVMGAVAFLIEYLDDTLKTPEEITQHLHLPVLGMIGHMSKERGNRRSDQGLYVSDNPLSVITEGFRTLRTNLEFAAIDRPIRILQVTSPGPSEGKTTIVANLGAIVAQGERRVLILDADLRKPTLHQFFNLPNRRGLVDVLRDPDSLDEVVIDYQEPDMKVITSGNLPPNPAELMASERMEQVLAELRELADLVIVDSPPGIISDPIALSAKVDGVLVVIDPGRTRIGAAQVLMEQLNRAGARVVGAVLNPVSRRNSHYYTKYGYHSSYYSSKKPYGSNGKPKSKEIQEQDQRAP
jgi:capsular exopolysaccharide synthesis family protein